MLKVNIHDGCPLDQNDIMPLLFEYTEILKGIYGNVLKRVVLFGSYARGDYDEDSDVDIMLLLDVPPEMENEHMNDLADATFDFNLEHDLYIMPLSKSIKTFSKWERVLPLYINVKKDGVTLYAA